MPFEPRLIAAEELPGEREEWEVPEDFELPGDLQELGARLQDEACELSRQFPPGERDGAPATVVTPRADAAKPPPPKRTGDPRWVAAAGSVLAGAAMLIAVIAAHVSEPSRPLSQSARPAHTRWESALERGERSTASRPAEVPTAAAAEDAGTSPALFLHDVSGPELEGLLDLLEEDGRSCDISI